MLELPYIDRDIYIYFVSVNFLPFSKVIGHNVYTAHNMFELRKNSPFLVLFSVITHEKLREKLEQWLYPMDVGKRS